MFNFSIAIGLLSMAVESYCLTLYPFLAPHLGKLLFGAQTSIQQNNLYAYGLFFLGTFIAAPIGGLFYGNLADAKGRKKSYLMSGFCLAVVTASMGLVPIFEFSWVIFLILICIQKFFSIGEYYIATISVMEHAKKSGLASGLGFLFSVLGIIICKILAESAISWRILFMAGGVCSFIGYLLKHYCQETPSFLQKNKEVSMKELLSTEYRSIIKTGIVLSFFGTIYSFLFYFLPLIITNHIAGTLLSLTVYGIMLLIAGIISEKISAETTMSIALICIIIFIFPLMALARSMPTTSMLSITILACFFIGPINNWMTKQFPTEIRCRGILISSMIKKVFSSHLVTPISLIIYAKTESFVMCGIYPCFIAILALIAINYDRLPSMRRKYID